MTNTPTVIRVMIANDDEMARHLWQDILNRADDMTCVGAAADGYAALEMAHRLNPDLILMDVMMPELDGVEATRRILSALPHIRVVIHSVHPNIRETALEAGAVAVLTTPITPQQLLTALRRVYG